MVTKEMGGHEELCHLWGKGTVAQGKGVTRGVVVFSQREDRIINAPLWVKLKLPARRRGMQVGASRHLDSGPGLYLRCKWQLKSLPMLDSLHPLPQPFPAGHLPS